jgi:hypothetical protein
LKPFNVRLFKCTVRRTLSATSYCCGMPEQGTHVVASGTLSGRARVADLGE